MTNPFPQPTADPFAPQGQQQQGQRQNQADPFGNGQQQQTQGQQAPSLNDALSGGGAKAAFSQNTPIGTVVQGAIIDTQVRQMTYKGKAKNWDNGDPQWQVVIRIQTQLRDDPNDDGKRAVYVKTWGPNFKALQDAIAATGNTEADKALAAGNVLSSKHHARQPSDSGNDELLYLYHIAPAGQAPPAANQQQQAAPPQQPQQQAQPQGQVQEEPPF